MPDSPVSPVAAARFRRELAARILGVVGASSLASASGCYGGYGGYGGGPGVGDATTSGATSPTSTSTTSSSSGNTGTGGATCGNGTPELECFPWSDTSSCPIDAATILATFTQDNCDNGTGFVIGSTACWVDPGSLAPETGECCYRTLMEFCASGGRPFLVDDRAQVARATFGARRTGWRGDERPCVDDLPPEVRAELASAWTSDGLLEHASIASFSRVSLALLAVGAPADLVERTHRAALDEVRHARLCFGLASAYAGEPVGPGAFPLGDAVAVPTTLAGIAVSTVLEGCVGETIAAVIAAEQLARAADPAVRTVLARIAADEARHAELAWSTVAWALEAGGADVERAVSRALDDALASASSARGRARGRGPALEAHGRLDAEAEAEARARALAQVIVPAARALLRGGHGPGLDSCIPC